MNAGHNVLAMEKDAPQLKAMMANLRKYVPKSQLSKVVTVKELEDAKLNPEDAPEFKFGSARLCRRSPLRTCALSAALSCARHAVPRVMIASALSATGTFWQAERMPLSLVTSRRRQRSRLPGR